MRCRAKHTSYQPVSWACPKCGAGEGELILESSPEDAAEDCELNHVYDIIRCDACEWEGSGSTFARQMKKIENAVKCVCCNGKGWVKKD